MQNFSRRWDIISIRNNKDLGDATLNESQKKIGKEDGTQQGPSLRVRVARANNTFEANHLSAVVITR